STLGLHDALPIWGPVTFFLVSSENADATDRTAPHGGRAGRRRAGQLRTVGPGDRDSEGDQVTGRIAPRSARDREHTQRSWTEPPNTARVVIRAGTTKHTSSDG